MSSDSQQVPEKEISGEKSATPKITSENHVTNMLDITKAPDKETLEVTEIHQHSPAWAEIVRPITVHLLWLLTAIMGIPFLVIGLVALFGELADPIEPMLDWAKTILPPLVGFGGAIVGYYFGTRGSAKANNNSEADDS